VLPRSFPQPFHDGLRAGSVIAGFAAHWLAIDFASPVPMLPIGRPLMNSAMRRFWASLSDCPSVWLVLVRPAKIRSGVIWRIS
jgi:hypothetical protein